MFPAALYPPAIFPGPLFPPSAKGIPAAPIALSATVMSPSSISISWLAANSGPRESGFVLQRSADSGATWVTIATPSATSFLDTGLSASKLYVYRLAATDADGVSSYSATVTATTSAAPHMVRFYPGLSRPRRARPR